jgi:2-deoxy-D-gluconate 3-dehydrogenase
MATASIRELFDLRERSAIVTGGAHGIGKAIAERLAEAGAALTIADLELGAAQEIAQRIRADGGRAQAVTADVGKSGRADEVVRAASEAFGSVDVLVNNAGIFPMSPALQTTEALWDRVTAVNLRGAFFFAQAAARRMIEGRRGGRIVNVSSINALHPSGLLAHYAASKSAMLTLSRSLALELAPHGIRVNTVLPGSVDTPGARLAMEQLAPAGRKPDGDTAVCSERIPLGRWASADDVARAVLFFCTAASEYITGASLVVDGGYLLT